MLNVIPLNDEREHEHAPSCWCHPEIRWQDAETEEIYANGPMVIHAAADCREIVERVIGGPVAEDKKWSVYEGS